MGLFLLSKMVFSITLKSVAGTLFCGCCCFGLNEDEFSISVGELSLALSSLRHPIDKPRNEDGVVTRA